MTKQTENKNNAKKKITSKQVVALAGVVLLVAMYLITLIVAIFDPDTSGRLFQACLVATIAIPLLIWIYIWMYGKLTGKHTMADPDLHISGLPEQNDQKQDS